MPPHASLRSMSHRRPLTPPKPNGWVVQPHQLEILYGLHLLQFSTPAARIRISLQRQNTWIDSERYNSVAGGASWLEAPRHLLSATAC